MIEQLKAFKRNPVLPLACLLAVAFIPVSHAQDASSKAAASDVHIGTALPQAPDQTEWESLSVIVAAPRVVVPALPEAQLAILPSDIIPPAAALEPPAPVVASREVAPAGDVVVPALPDVTLNLAGALPPVIDEANLRAALEPARVRLGLKPAQIESFVAAYQQRGGKPVWLSRSGDDWSVDEPRLAALRTTLSKAADHGLDAGRLLALMPASLKGVVPAEKIAGFDVQTSLAAFIYARDARGGRIEPSRLSNLMTPKLSIPAPDDVLAKIAAAPAEKSGAIVEGYQPRHAGYVALQTKLVALRAEREKIADAALTGSASKVASNADVPVRPAPSVSVVPDSTMSDIIANMERWRWLPEDLGATHIFVNVPEYKLTMMKDGAPIHQTRVIVGKPETQTPIFSDRMQFLIVNPSWHVPPSILRKEFIPRLAADPDYAKKRGFEVVRRGNQISVRQPPGERNALGNIKFMFPNHHSVYLHDTPGRHLFKAEKRAFSHGCVRVEAPFQLAERVLKSEFSEQGLRSMIGRGERTLKMAEHLPVHLAYFTLQVDAGGQLVRQPDIYGHDRRVKSALAL